MYVVDFETFPIEPRPDYPPVPVGVAIAKTGSGRGFYHAWGHVTGRNNTTKETATRVLREGFRSGEEVLFHNASFDGAVALEALGIEPPPWHLIHDTLALLFLWDPRAPDYHLKESAERILGRKPTARDEMGEWLLKHQPIPNVKLRKTSKGFPSAFTAWAPGTIAGRYAIGDTSRTLGLFKHLHRRILDAGMGKAYDLERRLLLGLLKTERIGTRVDIDRLRADVESYGELLEKLEGWLAKKLEMPEFKTGPKLVEGLLKTGYAYRDDLGTTPKGRVKSSREAIEGAVADVRLVKALGYRGQLATFLQTFMRPWLATAERSGGLIYTRWASHRTEAGTGARTGRLASSPNFQNVPKRGYDFPFGGKGKPRTPVRDLRPLPVVRSYIVPLEKSHVLIDRDYSQQELRILAHFTEGGLLDAYVKDPWLDLHDHARKMINGLLGTSYPRKPIKNMGFGLLYGMGLGALAKKNGTTTKEAKTLKRAYLEMAPGIGGLYNEMKNRAALKAPIATLAGRLYYVEPPKFVDGRVRVYDYKLVNLLIQGSAADVTKEAMARYFEANYDREAPLLLNVHDELLASTPRGLLRNSMKRLREVMDSVELDVPLLSEGSWSKRNWSELKDYDVKGKLVCRVK